MRWVALLVFATAFAGCADEPAIQGDEPDELPVTETTGCIQGVVINQEIVPISGATVTIESTGASQVTEDDGMFLFCDLEGGTYFLSAQHVLYGSTQTSWEVEEGVDHPAVLKIQMVRIAGLNPYPETFQFEGFYECAFALAVITDSCDMAVRTAHDAGAPVPRNLQNNDNTQYVQWSEDVMAVVQETWWNKDASSTFRSSLQDTPIDNDCDCSTKHMERKGTDGYIIDRMDKDNYLQTNTGRTQSWPDMDGLIDGEVAVRGFLPFQDLTGAEYAIDLDFQIFTTFFHSYTPPEGWTYETRDDYPVPS